MKSLLFFLLVFSSLSALATEAPLTKCDISSMKDAQTCMDKIASEHVEYNLPNIGSASTKKELLIKVLKASGLDKAQTLKTVSDADFVGVMLEKGDEWYLYYYALKNGKSQSVVEIESINLVDLSSDLNAPIKVKDLILGDQNRRFDAEDRSIIQDYLEE